MMKSKFTHSILIISVLLIAFSCRQDPKPNQDIEKKEGIVDWSFAHQFYLENITETITLLEKLYHIEPSTQEAKDVFKQLRITFKKAEPFASYLNSEVGHRVNGPALPVVTDDSQKILHPVGLQKLEESIFEGVESDGRFKTEVEITLGMLKMLQNEVKNRELTPLRFFIATHQQLLRIISFSLAGFDTPVTGISISEIKVSLRSLVTIYDNTLKTLVLEKDKNLDQEFHENVDRAIVFIDSGSDFETFDRFTFIRDYMNPITKNWVDIRKTVAIWKPVDNKPFNFDASTFFEEDAFNLAFFTPAVNQNPNAAKIALGKRLFNDPKVSGNGKMACVSCHNPGKGWGDGMALGMDNEGQPLQRNTPTLINSAFQQAFFWDGRSPNILDQISSVFNNEREFASSVHQFDTDILQDSTYLDQFKEAFGGISGRNTQIIKAISSYIATLNGFNSKFDRNIRGEEDTFTEEEKLGFNLFMGKGLCATCHFIPLTNGTVPPFFKEHESEVIGVPETAANKKLDDDLGRYLLPNSNLEVYYGMFKTPTVRNVEVTAPYMHNGVYQTLEEVVNFYNLGGGGGIGFDLSYQTLPFDNLELSKEEENALVAFMRTLTDVEVDTPFTY